MAIESTLVVRIVSATIQDRTTFLEEISTRLEPAEIQRIQAELALPMDEMYLIEDAQSAQAKGYVLLKPYDRLDHAVEMVLWLDHQLSGAESYREVLRETISAVSLNRSVDHIILKIEENKPDMIRTVESLGFLKEGIYISNQFLKGEFSFYSVYMYKLS